MQAACKPDFATTTGTCKVLGCRPSPHSKLVVLPWSRHRRGAGTRCEWRPSGWWWRLPPGTPAPGPPRLQARIVQQAPAQGCSAKKQYTLVEACSSSGTVRASVLHTCTVWYCVNLRRSPALSRHAWRAMKCCTTFPSPQEVHKAGNSNTACSLTHPATNRTSDGDQQAV